MNLKFSLSFFRNKFYPVIGMIGLFFIHSCVEDVPEPFFTNGVIRGSAKYYEGDIPYGIEVVSKGPYGTKTVSTNSTGSYSITGLGNGTYELVFKKDGYGSIYKYGIRIFGNDTVWVTVMLYQKVKIIKMPEFIEFYHSSSFKGMLGNEIIIETDSRERDQLPSLRFFLDTISTVSCKNYQYTDIDYPSARSDIDHAFYSVDLNEFPHKSGTELFLKAYVCNWDDRGYFDNYYGDFVYSTIDTKNYTKTYSYKIP